MDKVVLVQQLIDAQAVVKAQNQLIIDCLTRLDEAGVRIGDEIILPDKRVAMVQSPFFTKGRGQQAFAYRPLLVPSMVIEVR